MTGDESGDAIIASRGMPVRQVLTVYMPIRH
jgi:hypothetical protein